MTGILNAISARRLAALVAHDSGARFESCVISKQILSLSNLIISSLLCTLDTLVQDVMGLALSGQARMHLHRDRSEVKRRVA